MQNISILCSLGAAQWNLPASIPPGHPASGVVNFPCILVLYARIETGLGFKIQVIIVLRDFYNPRTEKQLVHLPRTECREETKSSGGPS